MSEQPLTDGEKLRTLATWFDHFDDWREATGKIAPGIADYREVQEDLRRIAATLDAARAGVPGDAREIKRGPCVHGDPCRESMCSEYGRYAGVPGDEGLRAAARLFAEHVSSIACDHPGAMGGTHTGCPPRLALDKALSDD